MDDATPAAAGPTDMAPETGLPPIAPDIIEQDHGDEFDNIVPTRGYQMLPVVGLGGSAGSIPALQRFFAAMPADTRDGICGGAASGAGAREHHG